MTKLLSLMFSYGKTRNSKNIKWNEQTCHAFEEMMCAVTDGCNTDTLCDMFNGMIENVISPLFPARKHISKEREDTQNNFPYR